MDRNQIHPVIDKVYPSAEFRDAYRRIASGEHVGKVVIEVGRRSEIEGGTRRLAVLR